MTPRATVRPEFPAEPLRRAVEYWLTGRQRPLKSITGGAFVTHDDGVFGRRRTDILRVQAREAIDKGALTDEKLSDPNLSPRGRDELLEVRRTIRLQLDALLIDVLRRGLERRVDERLTRDEYATYTFLRRRVPSLPTGIMVCQGNLCACVFRTKRKAHAALCAHCHRGQIKPPDPDVWRETGWYRSGELGDPKSRAVTHPRTCPGCGIEFWGPANQLSCSASCRTRKSRAGSLRP